MKSFILLLTINLCFTAIATAKTAGEEPSSEGRYETRCDDHWPLNKNIKYLKFRFKRNDNRIATTGDGFHDLEDMLGTQNIMEDRKGLRLRTRRSNQSILEISEGTMLTVATPREDSLELTSENGIVYEMLCFNENGHGTKTRGKCEMHTIVDLISKKSFYLEVTNINSEGKIETCEEVLIEREAFQDNKPEEIRPMENTATI